MSNYMEMAREYVATHARYCNTVKPRPEPYVVRYPQSTSRAMFAASIEDLVRKVARAMRRRDA